MLKSVSACCLGCSHILYAESFWSLDAKVGIVRSDMDWNPCCGIRTKSFRKGHLIFSLNTHMVY